MFFKLFGDPQYIHVHTHSFPTRCSSDLVDTPRVVLTWHPSRDFTVYTAYSEGFRSGINQDPAITRAAPQFSPLKPDLLRNYELGVKGGTADGDRKSVV